MGALDWLIELNNKLIEIIMEKPRKTGLAGIQMIKEFEGFRSKPYLDAVGVPTIGYGATHYGNGVKVKMSDKPIAEAEASALLQEMLKQYEKPVLDLVKSKINQNQFDALVSFVYNLGGTNFAKSTLLKKVNANPMDLTISNEFMRWNKAGGKVLAGLTRRRKAEAELYFRL